MFNASSMSSNGVYHHHLRNFVRAAVVMLKLVAYL